MVVSSLSIPIPNSRIPVKPINTPFFNTIAPFTSSSSSSLTRLLHATNTSLLNLPSSSSSRNRVLAYRGTELGHKSGEEPAMTIKPAVRIAERKLVVKDRTILTNVPENVIATSGAAAGAAEGVFLGAAFDQDHCSHSVSLGTLRDVQFLACFRFKLWWMAQKMGDKGRDIPLETQFLLLETKEGSHLEADDARNDNKIVYTVFLPLIEGKFKACLQGNAADELELCLESGDSDTVGSTFTHSVYINCGTDPFATIEDAIKAVKLHLGTLRLRHEKKLPRIVDCFGWCTWDAFYQEVTQEGVEAGLESLKAGGTPPKFVIIDDGWQSVGSDKMEDEKEEQGLLRLTGIKENDKFKKKEDPSMGIKNIVNIAKEKHGLKYVYVWHAITGYWGGVRPEVEEMKGYGSAIQYPKLSKGVLANEPGWKTDAIALNFPNNGYIACMSHNLESLYCSKQTGIVRASDDFYPRDPVSHTIHIAVVAYNSVFLGEIMLPDWDMFHSLHPAAEYHGSARAISGGPVYVSDAPGKHNFELLRKLVLPDGSILRPRLPGRPTKDCLFSDPSRDGVSLLKIWNINKHSGVLGVYNCQGAAWNSVERKNTHHQTKTEAITGYVRGRDVHFISNVASDSNWDGHVAIYSHRVGEVIVLPYNVAMPVSLKVLEHEVYTVTPIKTLAPGFSFAPFGLINMFNGGGAIEGLNYEVKAGAELSDVGNGYQAEENNVGVERAENLSSEAVAVVSIEAKGCGRFGAYSSTKPRKCKVGSEVVDFEYYSASGLVTLNLLEMPREDEKVHKIEIEL
ncbi:putative galactinol--sucrose galactosyltransferase 6 [Salvia divinorum]|uniref:galactinol--sucrose galactosyltransferase n=1 Tax=Salvia divinorum TaxID=28513 RepID=A0ABD1HHS6_SALDI